jgi:hypothetical protein
MRVGALRSLKVGDLEKIDDVYKIRVYAGDKEEKESQKCLMKNLVHPTIYAFP